jgi:uncharacterized protein (TIGR03790 family)
MLVLAWQTLPAFAGGSGLNVMVVVNQTSTNSVQLGNEYCEKRGVPPQNLFRMTNWTFGATAWTRAAFENYLRNPLLARLSDLGLTNQITHVLLSMDVPYRVEEGESANSTTSVLYYGFKTNTPAAPNFPGTCSLPDFSSNSFAFSETPFELATPNTAETNSFLSFMLTDNTLAGAQAVLARGVAADSTFPTQTVYLEKTSDPARNVRFFSFDNAVFDSRVKGDSSVVRIDSDSTSFESIRGLLTGFATLSLSNNVFAPGALGDSLTSYAGALFDGTGQTTLLAFLDAGGAASYGTVVEPCNYLQKFPDPMAFIYQGRGFGAAEAYYQSVLNPYQGLFVGEPLSAPFAAPARADWSSLTNGAVLSGQAELPPAVFTGAETNLPIGRVDLFIDGAYARTLTNIAPAEGTTLSLTVNGITNEYAVPADSTLFSVTKGVANLLNTQSNLTQVAAFPFGDRIELQSLDVSRPGNQVMLTASSTPGSTLSLNPAQPNCLDTLATGYFGPIVTNATSPGDWLLLQLTKTNGSQVSLSVTNVGTTNVAELCQSLLNAVNASPDLQGPDGIVGGELYQDVNLGQFFLYARSAGWPAAKVQANLSASSNLVVLTAGEHAFEDNLSDLRPRDQVFLSCGWAQLSVPVTLDTTPLADGFHELRLVEYEGTSVRTQTHISRTVQVRNGNLSAGLSSGIAGTNVSLDTPLTVSIQANSINISSIDLYTTGGLIGTVSNQATASFAIPLTWLGVGLHPFYALVSDSQGNRFRTQTLTLRIIPPLALTLSSSPLKLSWSSVPGLSYDILASSALANGFQRIDTVTATAATAEWPVPSAGTPSFYRLRLSP